ncbi:hypothetical protein [Pseudomonas fluorescens]|uniref:Uncharacterized protein n=1 Tax=Pseudomonas fluorescens TaxID=294 RepID=A0A109KQB6_PSEFL|nr:hypothetical protein [Pseudomonas fluorescens]KWV73402.1 hypothetical protein PFL603g_03512 [Pseudomonas fluorescens]
MSKPSAYRLLHRLDHRQAIAWLLELTGVELDAATLGQACIDADSPPEIDTTRLHLMVAKQSVVALGVHSVVSAHLADPYAPSIRLVVELEDGLLAEGIADLRSTPLLFRPAAIEDLANRMGGSSQKTGIELLQQELEIERSARLAAEANPKSSHLIVISVLLELLKAPVEHPRLNGMRQNAVVESILEKFPLRGLSKRNLETIFSEANTRRKEIE